MQIVIGFGLGIMAGGMIGVAAMCVLVGGKRKGSK